MANCSRPKGPNDFVSEAYSLDDDDKMVEFYSKWADDYDQQMLGELGYISPITIARLLIDYLPQQDSRIFDIGCGTGLTCALLSQQGYRNLDGIDLSPDMVRVAGNLNIYKKLIVGDVNQPLNILDGIYDAAISSGTFTHGHVGSKPLDEIFRILKSGGILACTIHRDLWQSEGFEAKFESLINQKLIECLSLEKGQYYENGDLEGWFSVYRKL